MPGRSVILLLVLIIGAVRPAGVSAASQATCTHCPVASVQPKASQPLGKSDTSHGCKTGMKNSLPVPDPVCTPGAVNPTVTVQVLKNSAFRTGCVRDCVTSESEKSVTYQWYGIPHPSNNEGASQTCELDHLVPLELGGADTLDNIWPQCGPPDVQLAQRYFKQKDMVENYLANQAKTGKMNLAKAQAAIAADWTQFLSQATKFCSGNPSKCAAAK